MDNSRSFSVQLRERELVGVAKLVMAEIVVVNFAGCFVALLGLSITKARPLSTSCAMVECDTVECEVRSAKCEVAETLLLLLGSLA